MGETSAFEGHQKLISWFTDQIERPSAIDISVCVRGGGIVVVSLSAVKCRLHVKYINPRHSSTVPVSPLRNPFGKTCLALMLILIARWLEISLSHTAPTFHLAATHLAFEMNRLQALVVSSSSSSCPSIGLKWSGSVPSMILGMPIDEYIVRYSSSAWVRVRSTL
jgi:hypothetical protein